jgi:hypothetical protein
VLEEYGFAKAEAMGFMMQMQMHAATVVLNKVQTILFVSRISLLSILPYQLIVYPPVSAAWVYSDKIACAFSRR